MRKSVHLVGLFHVCEFLGQSRDTFFSLYPKVQHIISYYKTKNIHILGIYNTTVPYIIIQDLHKITVECGV